jgi:hypothetical protein
MKKTKPAKRKKEPEPKYEKPPKLEMSFDEAMKRLVRVPYPPQDKK